MIQKQYQYRRLVRIPKNMQLWKII